MSTEVQQLFAALERISELHGLLAENLRAEAAAMGSVDVKVLTETTQAKEAILAEIWAAEGERQKAAAALGAGLSLLQLADRFDGVVAERMRAFHHALSRRLEECRELNRSNMRLVEESLGRIDAMKSNILGLGNNTAENYNAQGNRNPVTEQGGRLLSQRA